MRMPRAEPRRAVLLGMVAVAATATLLATSSRGAGQASAPATSALSWAGLVGSRPQVATGGRVIVLLRTPSLAQRVAAAGGSADAARERAWTGAALAAQKQLISRLAAQGVTVRPDYSFSRVLDGFSAVAGGSAVALLERDPAVAGVYPVRIAYPASVSTQVLARADFGPGSGHRPGIRLAGARRTRRHDRAPRHGRRRGRSVPARPRARRDRPRRRRRRRARRCESGEPVRARAARDGDGGAARRRRRSVRDWPESPAARRSCRSASRAGSRTRAAARRCTRAATS